MLKRWLIGGALALGLAAPAAAQQHQDSGGATVPGVFDVSGGTHAPQYCQITVTPVAATLAALLAAAGCPALPVWASVVYVTPESASLIALRWRADGTAPTAALGDPMFGNAKDPSIYGAPAVAAASLISATGANVTASVRIGG